MELLVVLGIVSTVVVSATDIFMLTGRASRRIFSLERSQADARYTMEAMTREIRNGQIDYAFYPGGSITSPVEELALIDSTNAKIRFHKSVTANESACVDAVSRPCLLVTLGTNPPVALTPQGVTVGNVKFYVSPSVDPFVFSPSAGTFLANAQPRVTLMLMLQSYSVRAGEPGSTVYTQTTVTSRAYRR